MVAHAGWLVPQIVTRWARLYADHTAVSAAFTYLHFVAILVGGGFAVAADWGALRLARERSRTATWPRELATLSAVHRWVIAGLVVSFVSGVCMTLADLPTYLPSPVYWTKLGLIALLIANGRLKQRAEAAVLRDVGPAWRRFRMTAVVSLVLWFAVLLAGTLLMTAA